MERWLNWDPRGEESSNLASLTGDISGVLAALDAAIANAEPGFDLASSLSAKAIVLAELARPAEAVAAAQMAEDVLGSEDESVRLAWAYGRLDILFELRQLGEHAAAEQAARDMASFYRDDAEVSIRVVAIHAEDYRFRALADLGRSEAIPGAWASLRDRFGADDQCEIRRAVARAGGRAALEVLYAGRTSEGLAICEDVIALYKSDADAGTRAAVVAVLHYRVVALKRARRPRGEKRAAMRDVVHFIGPHPEPEVVAAYRRAHSGRFAVRLALWAAHDEHDHD